MAGLNTLDNKAPAPAPASSGWAPQDKSSEPAPQQEPTLNQPSYGDRSRGNSFASGSSQPFKTEEQLKKEAAANALFGGPEPAAAPPLGGKKESKKEKKEKKPKKEKSEKKDKKKKKKHKDSSDEDEANEVRVDESPWLL